MYFFTRIILSATLTLILLVIELVLSHFTHSISLLAVANQSMYNLLTLIISASTIILVHNKSPAISLRSTFSWKRLEVVGSLSSLVFLGSLFFGTFVEGLQTITHSGHLDVMHNAIGVFVLAGGHFFTWIFIFALIGGYSRHQNKATLYRTKSEPLLNDRDTLVTAIDFQKGIWFTFKHFIHESSYIDIFRDLASCFALMVTSLVVYFVDPELHPRVVKYVDPLIAITSIFTVSVVSIPLVKRSCAILLQTIPGHLDKNEILEDVRKKFASDIINIHEFHLWCLVPPTTFATLHVIFKDEETYVRMNSQVIDLLKSKGVQNITLQPEFLSADDQLMDEDGTDSQKNCLFLCDNEVCLLKRCCISVSEKFE